MVNDCLQEMEDLSTDSLMRMQVEQLEREKKELNQRLRTAAKRIDHIERAYRKEERPLLAQDYAEQQAADRTIFEALQHSRIEGARKAFEGDMATKKRLSRMMQDYQQRKELIVARRSEDHKAKLAESLKRVEEEKEQRRAAYRKEKEEEERQRLEAERILREQEEEEARQEAGKFTIRHIKLSFLRYILQSGAQPRKRPRPRNVKSKRKLPKHAGNGKRSVPKFKRKQGNVLKLRLRLRHVPLNAARSHCTARHNRRSGLPQRFGGVRVRLLPFPHVVQPPYLLPQGRKVLDPLLPPLPLPLENTDLLVHSAVRVKGLVVPRPLGLPLPSPLYPVPHRLNPIGTMDSSLFRRRRYGDLGRSGGRRYMCARMSQHMFF